MQELTFDTETTGLSRWHGARMFAFSTCDWNGNCRIYRHEASAKPARYAQAERRLKELWSSEGARRFTKTMHNAKFDTGMVKDKMGLTLSEMRKHDIHETMALSHLVQNLHPSHRLADLGWEIFGYTKKWDEAVKEYKRADNAMLACPEWICDKYQHADAERTMLLRQGLSPIVKRRGLWPIYEMERQLVWTTLAIQERGMFLKRDKCKELIDWCWKEAQKALRNYQAREGPGSRITDNALRRLIYTKMGMPIEKLTKTKLPSVEKSVVFTVREKTKDPIFDEILKYKSYSRGISILEDYLALADANDIIHPSIHCYGTDTSRESCSKPNLQNVQTTGRLLSPYPVPARQAFGPRPGYVNYHKDYAGLEMCGLVHYAQDPEMMQIIKEGGDTHAEAAREFYGSRFTRVSKKRQYKLWKAMRGAAKNGDFCKCYAGGITALARTLGLDLDATRRGDARYNKRFPKMAALNRRDSGEVRATGHVVTFFGRVLNVPKAKPYAGTNYKVQGGCAGIVKRAQIRVDNFLEKATGGECGIVLPNHDELIIEVPRKRIREYENELLPKVIELMLDFPEVSVPLRVETKLSINDWNRGMPVETAA